MSAVLKLGVFWRSLIISALLLAQGGALAHELVHDSTGEPESCATCPLAKQLQHAATTPDHAPVIFFSPGDTPAVIPSLNLSLVHAAAKARAPPAYS